MRNLVTHNKLLGNLLGLYPMGSTNWDGVSLMRLGFSLCKNLGRFYLLSPDIVIDDLNLHPLWPCQEGRFHIFLLFDDSYRPLCVIYTSTVAVPDRSLVIHQAAANFSF